MIKTKFVIMSERRFTETDKLAIIMAIKDLYKDDIKVKDYYTEEKTAV